MKIESDVESVCFQEHLQSDSSPISGIEMNQNNSLNDSGVDLDVSSDDNQANSDSSGLGFEFGAFLDQDSPVEEQSLFKSK